MNDVYFACEDCRVMADAGYRWAYWELEHPGIVHRRKPISAEAVGAAVSYWAPPVEPSSKWLTDEVLPTVRSFLTEHGPHRVTYGDAEEIVGPDPAALFDWLEVGHSPELTPRYFVDVLRLASWAQVLEWARTADRKPWWWDEPELKDRARVRFQEMAAAAQPGIAADDRLPRSARSPDRR